MSELEKVINKIFDEQEQRFKEMFDEALGRAMVEQREEINRMFGSCCEKWEAEMESEDDR